VNATPKKSALLHLPHSGGSEALKGVTGALIPIRFRIGSAEDRTTLSGCYVFGGKLFKVRTC